MDNIVKTCVFCITEKRVENFSNKFWECKPCDTKSNLKLYYNNRERISQQRRKIMHILKT